jgi:hypothetical protein
LDAEQKKQQKEEERLAKEADRQLQDDFQQAKKIPKKSSKASRQQNLHTNKPVSAEFVAEAPPTVNPLWSWDH